MYTHIYIHTQNMTYKHTPPLVLAPFYACLALCCSVLQCAADTFECYALAPTTPCNHSILALCSCSVYVAVCCSVLHSRTCHIL